MSLNSISLHNVDKTLVPQKVKICSVLESRVHPPSTSRELGCFLYIAGTLYLGGAYLGGAFHLNLSHIVTC